MTTHPLASWAYSSHRIALTYAEHTGLTAEVAFEDKVISTSAEGLPPLSTRQIEQIPFQEGFYPTFSRLNDGTVKVHLHARGLGGCLFSCFSSEDAYEPLLSPKGDAAAQACQNGNLVELTRLLDEGVSPDSTNSSEGLTLAFIAARNGRYDCLELLLDRQAKPNKKTAQGLTPLYGATTGNHALCITLLLNKGADPTLTDQNGDSPVGIASYAGFSDSLEVLLNHPSKRVNPNQTNNEGKTPAILAAFRGQERCLSLLITAGADLTKKSKRDAGEKVQFNPLHAAAIGGHNSCVTLLLNHRVDINAPDGEGNRAVHLATIEGKPDCLHTLIERGADITLTNNQGHTPYQALSLMLALMSPNNPRQQAYKTCANLLWQNGVSDKGRTDFVQSPEGQQHVAIIDSLSRLNKTER